MHTGIRVQPGTAQTFEHLQSGFKFRVAADNRVEPELVEKFSSPQFIESAEDRRLRVFLKEQVGLRGQRLPEAETRAALEASLQKCLGSEWTLGELHQTANGMMTSEVRLNCPGEGQQEVSLSFYESAPKAQISTSAMIDGWAVAHSIEGPADGSSWMESAQFKNPA